MVGKLHIKVCGMKSSLNREELDQLPVDYYGFIFYPMSPRYVYHNTENEMNRLFSTGRKRAGIFVDALPGDVISIANKWDLTHVQLHGNESSETCRIIRGSGLKVIRSFSVDTEFDFEVCRNFAEHSDLFLFDTKGKLPGGTGEKFNWEILENYRLEVPFFLSGGISPGDGPAIAAFSHPMFYGIDLNSGFEDAPGIKNTEKLKSFLKNLRNKE